MYSPTFWRQPCKFTSVPEFLLPRKTLDPTTLSWRIFAYFQVPATVFFMHELSFPRARPSSGSAGPQEQGSGVYGQDSFEGPGYVCVLLLGGRAEFLRPDLSSCPVHGYCWEGLDTHDRRKSPGCLWLPVFLWRLVKGPCWMNLKDKNHKKLIVNWDTSGHTGSERRANGNGATSMGSATRGDQAGHSAGTRKHSCALHDH